MATALLPPATPFAALEAALGAATHAAMANVVVVLPGGVQAAGVLSEPYAQGPGALGMPGRDVTLLLRTSALAGVLPAVGRGSTISTGRPGGRPVAWQVVRRGDIIETGDTELQLEAC